VDREGDHVTRDLMAVVVPSESVGGLRPLDARGVHVTGGFWAGRLATNRERTIPHGLAQLEASGALGNFRNAARGSGIYVGGMDDAGITFPFLDSDVYKWLEAVGWELGRAPDARLEERAGEVVGLVAAAQRPDGYLGTFVQLSGRPPFGDLAWGHELYCIGHLVQAAIAWLRSLGDDRLLGVARRAIDRIDAELGEGRREGIDGHPEIEMALVELFRATGEERYLGLARLFIERRGHGLLGSGRLGSRYWQDHATVREAPTVAGHAVRQMYLECGAVDVAVETGDSELLGAVVRRWEDMWATRTYLTGALGSRHRDEAFGDPMELPSDRAYAETCAAIGSVMLSWRLLLATGDARYADALERTMYNAVLPGVSLDGTRFFYSNPLHRRARAETTGVALGSRAPWYPCACCPPNLMRTLSSFEHLLATSDEAGIAIWQFADSSIEGRVGDDLVRLRVETAYPWQAGVRLTVEAAPGSEWTLRLRAPAWARGGRVEVAGVSRSLAGGTTEALRRSWRAGDQVLLELPMDPRMTVPDERVDAVRGCVAVERGPLVYCVEQADLPDGQDVDALVVRSDGVPRPGPSLAALEGMPSLELAGRTRVSGGGGPGWPYRESSAPTPSPAAPEATVRAIPYFAWANRTPGSMRVWLPTAPVGSRST
jgi:hypothetical protein